MLMSSLSNGLRMAAAASHDDVSAAPREIDGDRLSQTPVGSGHEAYPAVDADAGWHRFERRCSAERVPYCRDDRVAHAVVVVVHTASLTSVHGRPGMSPAVVGRKAEFYLQRPKATTGGCGDRFARRLRNPTGKHGNGLSICLTETTAFTGLFLLQMAG